MAAVEQGAKVLSIAEAARFLGKSEDWLRQKIRRGEGPPARRISPGRICIFHRELIAWLDGLEQVSRPRMYGHPDPEFTIDVSDCADEGK